MFRPRLEGPDLAAFLLFLAIIHLFVIFEWSCRGHTLAPARCPSFAAGLFFFGTPSCVFFATLLRILLLLVGAFFSFFTAPDPSFLCCVFFQGGLLLPLCL